MIKVGIPRALLYYEFYPLWRAFFEGVGGEVITSPITQRDTVATGAARVVADTCLPV
ncbi:MAG: acyl-CoA dehydratase activase-related protein, partial [Chloroflexota bacterium]|nr:acyl-CoA dehydratase activase-related protein [Chloroflexota bacterium]